MSCLHTVTIPCVAGHSASPTGVEERWPLGVQKEEPGEGAWGGLASALEPPGQHQVWVRADSGSPRVTQYPALENWITERLRLSKLPKVCCLRAPRGPRKNVPVLLAAGLRGGGMGPSRVQSFLFPSAAFPGLPACWNVGRLGIFTARIFPSPSNRFQLEPGNSSWLNSVPTLSGRCICLPSGPGPG